MRRRGTMILLVFGAITVSVAVGASGDSRASAQVKPSKELEAAALKTISELRQIPMSDLELERSAIVIYRYSQRKVNEFIIGNRRNDDAYQVLLTDGGEVLDARALLREEEAARLARYGKLSEDLYQYLQLASADEEIELMVMLDLGPDTDRPNDEPPLDSQKFKAMTASERQKLNEKIQDFDRRLIAYNTARAKRVMDPVVRRLRELGSEPVVIDGTDTLGVKLKPEMIRQIETWPEIRLIGYGGKRAIPLAPRRPM